MLHQVRVLFFLWKSKTNKKKEAPLYIRLSRNGKRKQSSTGFYIQPKHWDEKNHCVKADHPRPSLPIQLRTAASPYQKTVLLFLPFLRFHNYHPISSLIFFHRLLPFDDINTFNSIRRKFSKGCMVRRFPV